MILIVQTVKIIDVLRLQQISFHESTSAIYKRNEFPFSWDWPYIFMAAVILWSALNSDVTDQLQHSKSKIPYNRNDKHLHVILPPCVFLETGSWLLMISPVW